MSFLSLLDLMGKFTQLGAMEDNRIPVFLKSKDLIFKQKNGKLLLPLTFPEEHFLWSLFLTEFTQSEVTMARTISAQWNVMTFRPTNGLYVLK